MSRLVVVAMEYPWPGSSGSPALLDQRDPTADDIVAFLETRPELRREVERLLVASDADPAEDL